MPPSGVAGGTSGAESGRSDESEDAAAIRQELIDMWGQPGLAAAFRERLTTRLFEDGAKEEWARFELLDILGDAQLGLTPWVDILGGADVTAEECVEHGWPPGCFTACTCASRCMVRLARRDGGAVIGGILERLRSARKLDEAAPSAADKRGEQLMAKSVWRSSGLSGLSPLLQAVLLEEQAATAEQRGAATAFETTALAVNAELVKEGCCRNGRVELIGLCRNWLSYKRKEGGARDAVSRQKERQSIEAALAADPCAKGCVLSLSSQNARMFVDEYNRAPTQPEREVCASRCPSLACDVSCPLARVRSPCSPVAHPQVALKQFLYDAAQGCIRPYCNEMIISLVPVGRPVLAKVRGELLEDGCIHKYESVHGLVTVRQKIAPGNRTDPETEAAVANHFKQLTILLPEARWDSGIRLMHPYSSSLSRPLTLTPPQP